jgi:parallel beta-helix repeat protein
MGKTNKSLTILLILLFLTSLTLIPQNTVKAQRKTIIVPNDFPTIQGAINNANDGDIILLRKGTYHPDPDENGHMGTDITIDKRISLIGEDKEKTIIEGVRHLYIYTIVTIESDNVTISNLTLDGTKESMDSLGIGGSGCRVTGNILIGDVAIGGENCTFSKNRLTNSRLYIHGSNNLIEDNSLMKGYQGIALDSCQNVTVRDNVISNMGTVGDSGGLYLSGGPFYIYRNNITDNRNFGIEFNFGSSNVSIFQNNILRNKVGINLISIDSSAVGLKNFVFYNNFEENEQNVAVEHENLGTSSSGQIGRTDVVSWDNGAVGNYWSDYRGIGNYVIDENNIDHYPLTKPIDISTTAPTSSPFQSNTTPILLIIIAATSLALITVLLLFYRRHRKTVKINQ